ncbi:MAG: T9SS type A sorting domain-containing protein [Bacteroidia bacterium]|nr:T9SS type A sorting domain-containing protein [Bacteroidia bacterium]
MRKYIFLFFVSGLLFQSGYAQLIRSLDKGLQQFNQNIQTIYSYGNDVYVVTNMGSLNIGSNFEYAIKIAKWNGISWSYLPTLRAISSLDIPAANYFIKNLCVFKDELYISGMFDSISGVTGSCGIVKWNNSTYQSVGGGFEFSDVMKQNPISASQAFWGMAVWGNQQLVVAAEIKKAGTKNLNNLAMWDGSSWNFVGKTVSTQGFTNSTPGFTFKDYFKGIGTEANHIIIHGNFTSVGGNSAINTMAYWNDSNWTSMTPETPGDQSFFDGITNLIPDPDRAGLLFYAAGTQSYGYAVQYGQSISKSFTSSGFVPKTLGNGTTMQPLIFWHNGNFWGLGTNNYFYELVAGSWTKKGYCKSSNIIPSTLVPNAEYSLYLNPRPAILGGMFTYGNDTLNYIGKFSDGKGVLSGRVYLDQNNNCQFDLGETLIKNAIIQHSGGFVSSNENGLFSIQLTQGLYSVSLAKIGKNLKQICPGNNGSYSVICFADSIISGLDFAVKPDSNIVDVQLSLIGESGWRARRGFTEKYLLKVQNSGSLPVSNFSVYLQVSSKTKAQNFSPQPTQINGTVYKFDIGNLATGELKNYSFSLQIPGPDSINIGDSILLLAYCSPNINSVDSDLTDNSDTLRQTITSAYDPNDKQSNPHIYILPNVKKIDYQIRFQNIGSDTAYGVTVLDTVDTRLPLKEITINSASHPYRFAVINNVLFWRFDGIMLPPVKTDEPRSHGWIRYSSKLAQGLPIGTEILNKAYIYFDYEKAVITNEALIRLVQDTLAMGTPEKPKALNETIRMYPNPAGNFFVLENTGNETENIEVYSLIGEKIQVFSLKKETQLIINTTDWKNGVYFIRSSSAKATTLVIQH